jgi:hypothetical protein
MKYLLRKESDPFEIVSFNNHDRFEGFQAVTMKNIVTCISDYRRALDWIDLLTTYRSQLQMTITLFLISTLQII